MVFPIVMYRWELDHKEGWVSRNWYFQTVVLKTLGSPLDSKEIKPVSRKENQPWILMLKLKLQYFGHLMWRANSLEETLMLGKIESRRRGRQRMRWLGRSIGLTQWTRLWANSGRQWRTGNPGILPFMGLQRVRHEFATEQMLNVDVSQSDQRGLQNNPEKIKIVSLGEI